MIITFFKFINFTIHQEIHKLLKDSSKGDEIRGADGPSNKHVAKGGDESNPEQSKGCVLLIDDSPVAAKVASKVLTNLKFEVVSCNSAQIGFDALKASPNKFVIVFLDVVMPKVGNSAL